MTGELGNDPKAGERLLASACKFLRDGGDDELASLLASCEAVAVVRMQEGFFGGTEQMVLDIYVLAPRAAYDLLTIDTQWNDDPRVEAIDRAINAVIAPPLIRGKWEVRAELIEPDDDWRSAYGASKPRPDNFKPPPAELPAASRADDDIPF